MRRSRIVAHERRVRDDERGVERSRGERGRGRRRFDRVRKEQRDVKSDGRYVRGDVEKRLGLVTESERYSFQIDLLSPRARVK